MQRLIIAIVVALALIPSLASSQDPPPGSAPVRMTLRETSPGQYVLRVVGGAAVAPYTVRALVLPIGSDNGVFATLGESDQDEFFIEVKLPLLEARTDVGCYHVSFMLTSPDGTDLTPEVASGRLITRACVDVVGTVTFPAYDKVMSPRPAPPSHVRVLPQGDSWRIEWQDNSADEVAFDTHINFLDSPLIDGEPGGNILASMELPEVPANWTGFGSLGFLFTPDEPVDPVCGYALVLVYSIGRDSSSFLPGTTQVPACFGRGTLSFPDTGTGGELDRTERHRHTVLLLLIGVTFVATGTALRRKRPHL